MVVVVVVVVEMFTSLTRCSTLVCVQTVLDWTTTVWWLSLLSAPLY